MKHLIGNDIRCYNPVAFQFRPASITDLRRKPTKRRTHWLISVVTAIGGTLTFAGVVLVTLLFTVALS
jgi:hypothetical protein